MNARSALFDLYGDHLVARGGAAPIAALVRLLAPLAIAAPAVRTAVSRMVRQDWLTPVRLTAGPGYRLTPQAEQRLSAAAQRIYRRDVREWDGRWHLLVLDPTGRRGTPDRTRGALSYLGYAPLRDDTWVSPRESAEVDAVLATAKVSARRFRAELEGDDAALAAGVWDLESLDKAYTRWLEEARMLVGDPTDPRSDEEAFTIRTRLVHEWRKFLFSDPGLPRSLLPTPWAGDAAAEFFDVHAAALQPATERFVDACLAANGGAHERR